MKKLDAFEKDILAAYEAGELKSISPSKADISQIQGSRYCNFCKGQTYQYPLVLA